ncbi:MAG: hypothetical protein CM15mP109_05050 [Candidatus Dadabacteria bacterium]|nr:MAG: hypothetical protein CM15mP109_05050 [Candidatus Dadabacteria bacterium]
MEKPTKGLSSRVTLGTTCLNKKTEFVISMKMIDRYLLETAEEMLNINNLRNVMSNLEIAADKIAIMDVVYKYCRAIDRLDRELLDQFS